MYHDANAPAIDVADVDVLWFNLLPFAAKLKVLPWNPFRLCLSEWTWPDEEWRPGCLLIARRYSPHYVAPSNTWVET
ncbi:MAG: hypothetical protein ACPGR8_17325, partial [Limisphaerales bacterium]